MNHLLLLGDEAIAQAAMDGGISGVYAYPGTPSTEITEYIQKHGSHYGILHHDWSANEKTAYESALGMSYAGRRALVCMKHVGLNVAADAFINSAITGVNGGLVLVAADDPSMHSSQNEQDSRFFAQFAQLPVFEPSSQQEAYDMTLAAFDLSEKFKIPVMLRITTRLAHSRARINTCSPKKQNPLALPADPRQFILLPAIARKRYKALLAMQEQLGNSAEQSPFNQFKKSGDLSLGIICCGLAYNYYMEIAQEHKLNYPVLKIGQYPLPEIHIWELYAMCQSIMVLEDGYPLVEKDLKGFTGQGAKPVKGRLDGTLPRDGELTPDIVSRALGIETGICHPMPEIVANRPPQLCNGCGHIDLYEALNVAMAPYGKGKVFSDIGCYTLGALSPFDSISSCVDMGASVTMAKGAADAGLSPSVCVIGDSTFTHSGMTGLLDVVNENTPVTIIIADNSTTGMTGGQTSSAAGRIETICLGIGVDPAHLRIIEPVRHKHHENVTVLAEEIGFNGVSVIIARRECIQVAGRKAKLKKADGITNQ